MKDRVWNNQVLFLYYTFLVIFIIEISYAVCQGYILDENGKELPALTEGEICVKSPVIMIGYLDEENNNGVIDVQGRLHTGDLGYLDKDGYLHISGRKKDIIIRNGLNISCGKIEKAILSLECVVQTVVVGVKHEKFGEVPAALIIPVSGCEVTSDDISRLLINKLPKNEIPMYIIISENMPLTSSGKPNKQKIKEEILKKCKA